MNTIKKIFFFISFIIIAGYTAAASISITNLRCEYLNNPLGIDLPHPRLSWELTSEKFAKKQTAYRLLVSTDSLALEKNIANAWDSRKTKSPHTNQIIYAGTPLKANTEYYWKVCVWDEAGKVSDWSSVARFFVGPLSPDDWKAQWIGEVEYTAHADDRSYPFNGFRSPMGKEAEEVRSLTIDLGSEQSFDAIKLFPAYRKEKSFPLRFNIEIANASDFAQSRRIVDESQSDIRIQPAEFYYKSLDAPVKGRYVRINITRQAQVGDNSYEYALSEIEILLAKENIALGKPVTTSERNLVEGYSNRPYSWGNLYPSDANIITDGYIKGNPLFNEMYDTKIPPSPLLRKEIRISKPVARAFYSTSATGIYEAYINGEKVGVQCLAPEYTVYDKHLQYQTYDVSRQVKSGVNVLGAMLADGWYVGARHLVPDRGLYGYARRFLGQLIVFYEDGTSEIFCTDGSWKMQPQGPVTEAFYFTGEIYDARNEWKGWHSPGYNDSGWSTPAAYSATSISAKLCAQKNEPIAIIKELTPIAVHKSGHNKYVFDMGQNMVGWCRLNLPYNPGQPIRMKYAEMLYDDGSIYTDNLRNAKPLDIYRPHNESTIDYEPRFTYHGFRYVEIEGLTQAPQLNQLVGKVVASSSPVTGSFECSDADVNKLWSNIIWTQWGNLISIPTDCPQRDERLGWMGDAQIFSQTAIYNLDMAAFYTKWARDIRDSQHENGMFSDFSPNDGFWKPNFYGQPAWADAGVVIPWQVYRNYNDTSLLAAQYHAMKKYINYLDSINPDHLWRYDNGGNHDWLNGDNIVGTDFPKGNGKINGTVFSTAHFANSTAILARSAKILGHKDDAIRYSNLSAAIRKAFADAFISPDGKIEGNTQSTYAIALQFGLIPEHLRVKAAVHLVEAVKAYDYRASTGIQTTIFLMNQLSEYGYGDVAYRLLLSRRFPSWFYSIDQGATTIWERWDGYVAGRGFQDPSMNSFNHVAFGAVGEWMYQHILGINPDESSPGYRHFYIKPQPGGDLKWAKGSYHAITGMIDVSWINKNRVFTLDINIPVNTEATVVLPNGKTQKVRSGKHSFTSNSK